MHAALACLEDDAKCNALYLDHNLGHSYADAVRVFLLLHLLLGETLRYLSPIHDAHS